MTQFNAQHSDTEISGINVQALLHNIQHDDMTGIIERYGMTEIDTNAWYPLSTVLTIMAAIGEASNASPNLVSIGIAAADLGVDQLPPTVQNLSLEELLMLSPKLYQQRHRGSDAGEIVVEKASHEHYVVTLRVPYPDDVFYGIFYAYARRFCPKGRRFAVRYAPDVVRRDEGGSET